MLPDFAKVVTGGTVVPLKAAWAHVLNDSFLLRGAVKAIAYLLSQKGQLSTAIVPFLKWVTTGGSLEVKVVRWFLSAYLARKLTKLTQESETLHYVAGRIWAYVTRAPLALKPHIKDNGVIQNTSLGLVWCDPNDKRMYKLTPSLIVGDIGSVGTPQYSLTPLDATENLLAVHGGVDRAFTWPQGVFVICFRTDAGDMPVAHAYRSGNRAYFSRHLVEGPKAIPTSSMIALNPKTKDWKDFQSNLTYQLHCGKKHIPYSGSDLASVELPPFFWAILGVKSISENAFRGSAEGLVYMTTFGADGEMRTSRGCLIPQTSKDKAMGRVGYTISTEPGYSGSPIFQMVNGAAKVVAIHMCGSIDERQANFGVCVPDILHFRREIGATPPVELLCESSDKSASQCDRWERADDITNDDYGLDNAWADLADDEEFQQLKDAEREATDDFKRQLEDQGNDYAGFGGDDPGRRRRRARGDSDDEHAESKAQSAVPVHVNKWLPDTADREAPVREFSVSDADIKKQLGAPAPDPKVVSQWDPRELLSSSSFARYREYLAAGGIVWDEKETVISADCNGDPVLTRVGSSQARGSGKANPAKRLRSQFKEACAKHGVNMPDFILPKDDPAAVLESLRGQLTRHCARDLPFTDKVQAAFDEVCSSYERCDRPYVTASGIHQGVNSILDSLEGDKAAGWADQYRAGKKEVWKTPEGRSVASYLVRCRILLRLAWGSVAMGCMTPKQMVKEGLVDPRVPFIKREVTGEDKQVTKRWRLIWNCSVIDVLTAGITNRRQDKEDIYAYQDGRAGFHCVGMGHHDEGIRALGSVLDRIASKEGKLSSSDISGWDMGVQRDWIYLDGLRRIKLGPNSDIFRELTWCEQAATSAHVLFIGGILYQILRAGITASGILSTSAQNSFIRSLLELLAGALDCASQGDDNVSSSRHNDFLVENGVLVRDVKESGPCGPISFTSHELVKRGCHWFARFLNLDKMLARLELNRSGTGVPPADAMGGCLFALRHSKTELDQFVAVCGEMGWNTDVPVVPHEIRD